MNNVLLNVSSGVFMLKQTEESFHGVSDSMKPKVMLHNSVRLWYFPPTIVLFVVM